ncbi:hypothetical protein [Burkholderia gladioli]|uniref:hypothetical protein n=1 Tax=Burkholderia gladioli TaxID=28095 RepID=UPI001641A72F|nr:hypothetical protein [Burkholderia gladioli]
MNDFRPKTEPALSIYDALTAEIRKRKGKTFEEWSANERKAVLNTAIMQAKKLGLRAPTPAEVERAEQLAVGHSDYAAKWAGGVADIMRKGGKQ